ncbi:sugar phosphate isomerase/epimerase, partial [Verrucomicrobiota bacterium]
GLASVLPHLVNLHVFHWTFNEGRSERRPLAEGEQVWHEYLRLAASTGRDCWALIEFVREDSPEQLLEDARTLGKWISEGTQA